MTTTTRQLTHSGQFVVFHRSNAGSPSAFDDAGGDWFFEPNNPHGGDEVYSQGYPTADAALAAAEAWELQENTD